MTRDFPVSGSTATIQRSLKSSERATATVSAPSGETIGMPQRTSRGSSLPFTFCVPANAPSAQTNFFVFRLRMARRTRSWLSPTLVRAGMSSV